MPNSQAFLDEQVRLTTQLLALARTELAPQDPQLLQQRPAPDRWSVLDCLDHLNRYGRFYLPRLQAKVDKALAKGEAPAPRLRHGWLGAYFIRAMMPKPPQPAGKRKGGMAAMKAYDPLRTPADHTHTLAEFVAQQEQLLRLLQQARAVNLNRHRMGTTLGNWLTLKLGDLLGFLIAHNLRHMTQAQRTLAALQTRRQAA
jgi:hypothetical protein